jgi:hypothetical protein
MCILSATVIVLRIVLNQLNTQFTLHLLHRNKIIILRKYLPHKVDLGVSETSEYCSIKPCFIHQMPQDCFLSRTRCLHVSTVGDLQSSSESTRFPSPAYT